MCNSIEISYNFRSFFMKICQPRYVLLNLAKSFDIVIGAAVLNYIWHIRQRARLEMKS